MEAAVEHDIGLLVAGLKRIGSVGSSGKIETTFGAVFKDEARQRN
jgi:hypothetical protein